MGVLESVLVALIASAATHFLTKSHDKAKTKRQLTEQQKLLDGEHKKKIQLLLASNELSKKTALEVRRLEKLQDVLDELFEHLRRLYGAVLQTKREAREKGRNYQLFGNDYERVEGPLREIIGLLDESAFRFRATSLDAAEAAVVFSEVRAEMRELRSKPSQWARAVSRLERPILGTTPSVLALIEGREIAPEEALRELGHRRMLTQRGANATNTLTGTVAQSPKVEPGIAGTAGIPKRKEEADS